MINNDLMQWLRDQIAARRAAAEAVPEGERSWRANAEGNVYVEDSNVGVAFGPWDADLGEAGRHIALNDPAAALAHAEAHGQWLDLIEQQLSDPAAREAAEHQLAVLARAYQHREGYHSRWNVNGWR